MKLKYERLPRLCKFCGYLGHLEKRCQKLIQMTVQVQKSSMPQFRKVELMGRLSFRFDDTIRVEFENSHRRNANFRSIIHEATDSDSGPDSDEEVYHIPTPDSFPSTLAVQESQSIQVDETVTEILETTISKNLSTVRAEFNPTTSLPSHYTTFTPIPIISYKTQRFQPPTFQSPLMTPLSSVILTNSPLNALSPTPCTMPTHNTPLTQILQTNTPPQLNHIDHTFPTLQCLIQTPQPKIK